MNHNNSLGHWNCPECRRWMDGWMTQRNLASSWQQDIKEGQKPTVKTGEGSVALPSGLYRMWAGG